MSNFYHILAIGPRFEENVGGGVGAHRGISARLRVRAKLHQNPQHAGKPVRLDGDGIADANAIRLHPN